MADDLATQLAVQTFLLAMTEARLESAEATLKETQQQRDAAEELLAATYYERFLRMGWSEAAAVDAAPKAVAAALGSSPAKFPTDEKNDSARGHTTGDPQASRTASEGEGL